MKPNNTRPSTIECNEKQPTSSMLSSISSKNSYQIVTMHKTKTKMIPTPLEIIIVWRRNRKNVMLWSQRDTNMLFARISSALDEKYDEYNPPAQSSPCSTVEERQIIHCHDSNTEERTDTISRRVYLSYIH